MNHSLKLECAEITKVCVRNYTILSNISIAIHSHFPYMDCYYLSKSRSNPSERTSTWESGRITATRGRQRKNHVQRVMMGEECGVNGVYRTVLGEV